MTPRAFVLGGTGALGSAVLDVLLENGIDARASARSIGNAPQRVQSRFVAFDVMADDVGALLDDLDSGDFVVNCIGIIKPYIDDSNPEQRLRAIEVNSRFPYGLAEIARRRGLRVVQIATDCVYDGSVGKYDETAAHDALDVYGKSKSLGEVPSAGFINLRCSIIGPELKSKKSLLEWVLGHPQGSTLTGYVNHIWNGVTTRAFGQIVAGMIVSGNDLEGTFHIVPADVVTKLELSKVILNAYGRTDVTVVKTAPDIAIDRTLSTVRPDINARLWADAGYSDIPTVEQMVLDLAAAGTSNGE